VSAPASHRAAALVLNLVSIVFALRVRAAVLLTLAGWFVVPLFPGLVLPSGWVTVGWLLIVLAASKSSSETDEEAELQREKPLAAWLRNTLVHLVTSAMYLGIGALVRWLS
jgi:hypothetical protein